MNEGYVRLCGQASQSLREHIHVRVPSRFDKAVSLASATWVMVVLAVGLAACTQKALFVKKLNGTLHPSMGSITPLVGQLEGMKGMVLKVDGKVEAKTGQFVNQISAALYVNGDLVDGVIHANPCPAFSSCTMAATWWLDLDAAEAANPGKFIGKPLNIELGGGLSTGSGGNSYVASFSAQLLNK